MTLRAIANAITPPVIRDLVRGRRESTQTFPSWEAACAGSGTYQSDLVNRFRAERSALRSVDGSVLQSNVLNLLAKMIGKSDLVVTDFGGATGDLGADFLAAHPSSRYIVVENPTMVELMRERSRVEFSSGIPDSCDVFFTSSTLQYLSDPMATLLHGLRSAHHAAVLVRNCFAATEQFHVQRSRLYDNGLGPIPSGYSDCEISYPHRTIVESAVIDLALANGFHCIGRLEEHSGSVMPGSYGRQLIFLRFPENSS